MHRTPGTYTAWRLDQRRSSRGFVLGLVTCFAVVGWLWFLFASGFWNIDEIQINELSTLNNREVNMEIERLLGERGWRPWSKKNLIMLDAEELGQRLKDRIFANTVAVDKSFPNILRLKIEERQRSVVLVSNEQYVQVDTYGVVTNNAEGEILGFSRNLVSARAFADPDHLPVIIMATADPLAPGFEVAKPEQVRRWLDYFRSIVEAGIRIRFMKIAAPEASLARFVSERGYDIYFDLGQPLQPQINTYLGFMSTQPDESKIKEYLDVRVPGKIFTQ